MLILESPCSSTSGLSSLSWAMKSSADILLRHPSGAGRDRDECHLLVHVNLFVGLALIRNTLLPNDLDEIMGVGIDTSISQNLLGSEYMFAGVLWFGIHGVVESRHLRSS